MWKSIPEFNTYEASDEGFIRNVKTGRILKNSVKSGKVKGNPCVSLVSESKTHVFEVRFVIVCTFLGLDILAKPKPKVRNIDGDANNCALSNLEVIKADDLEGEEWRAVRGFEGIYEVSNNGRVKRLAHVDRYVRKDTGKETERHVSEKLIKVSDKDEYYEINLRYKDKSEYRTVHRMVAEAFVDNPNNLPVINHKNGDKHDNRAENLEWTTHQENIQHALKTGLKGSQVGIDRTQKKVRCIETNEMFDSIRAASEHFNIPESYLGDRVKDGKTCHGYHFECFVTDRRIKCLDTGEIFTDAAEVSRKMGLSSVLYAIARRTCIDGWTFCYVRDNVDEESYLQEARAKYSKWPRANKRWEKSVEPRLSAFQKAILNKSNIKGGT